MYKTVLLEQKIFHTKGDGMRKTGIEIPRTIVIIVLWASVTILLVLDKITGTNAMIFLFFALAATLFLVN